MARLAIGCGRAVHRQQPPLGREVVCSREHALFHLARVLGAQDDQFAVFKAQADAGFRVDAGRQPVGGEGSGVADQEVGFAEVHELLRRGTDEHGMHEQCVIRSRADYAYFDAIFRVPAGEAIEAIEAFARVEIIDRPLAIDVERVRLHGNIHRTPPDIGFGLGMADDPLVLRRATRLDAGVCHQRAVLGDTGILFVPDRVLIERAWREVVMDLVHGDPVFLQQIVPAICSISCFRLTRSDRYGGLEPQDQEGWDAL